jgi:YHS domain-containing protein
MKRPQSGGEVKVLLIAGLGLAALIVLPIFKNSADSSLAATSTHGHQGGEGHGPNVQSFANNHIEAQVSATGKVRLMVYGMANKEMVPLDNNAIQVEAQLYNEDPRALTIKPAPYPSDPPGKSSRFEGKVDGFDGITPVGLALTIVDQEKTYRVNFSPETLWGAVLNDLKAHDSSGNDVMPTSLSSGEGMAPTPAEKELFLQPGGIYTEADIKANGNTVAAAKFRGMMPRHKMSPAKGTRVCPITNTTADRRFAWIIGGKTYYFCCPPCVEEFVKQAKEKPETIKSPEAYVK